MAGASPGEPLEAGGAGGMGFRAMMPVPALGPEAVRRLGVWTPLSAARPPPVPTAPWLHTRLKP